MFKTVFVVGCVLIVAAIVVAPPGPAVWFTPRVLTAIGMIVSGFLLAAVGAMKMK